MAKDDPAAGGTHKRVYAVLRNAGIKKKKARRIAGAIATATRPATPKPAPAKQTSKKAASPKRATTKPSKSSPRYENWTKADLLARAKTVGVSGRSKMTKSQLIRALRAS